MADIEKAIEELQEHIDSVAADTNLSQADSVEIYEALAAHCSGWARTIRSEMS